MTFVLSNRNFVPYNGALIGQNVSLCTPAKTSPRSIVISINWLEYPGGAVEINLERNVINPLDQIRSVAINNAGNANAVTVIFPDTNFSVSCNILAQSEGPVITYQLRALIGTSPNATGITTIYLNNYVLNPGESSEFDFGVDLLALSGGTFGTFTPKVAGERTLNFLFDLNIGIGSQQILSDDGLITITSLAAYTVGNYAPVVITPQEYRVGTLTVPFFRFVWYAETNINNFGRRELYSQTGLNVRINSTNGLWIVNAGSPTLPGFLDLILTYTRYTP